MLPTEFIQLMQLDLFLMNVHLNLGRTQKRTSIILKLSHPQSQHLTQQLQFLPFSPPFMQQILNVTLTLWLS